MTLSLFEHSTYDEILTSFLINIVKLKLKAYDEVCTLKEAGELFTKDVYENYISHFVKRETVVKAMCLYSPGVL